MWEVYSAPFGISALLAKYESSLSERMAWCHIICWWYILFLNLYFNVVYFHVCSSSCHRMDFPPRVVGPFLILYLVLSYVSCTHTLCFLHRRMCIFSCGMNVMIVTNFVRKCIMADWKLLCLFDIRFFDDQNFDIKFICCLFTIYNWSIEIM